MAEVSRLSNKPELATKVSFSMINTTAKETFNKPSITTLEILKTDYSMVMES